MSHDLTPEQHERLESLNWVLYITEDGEEYFGKVGTDFTQWDIPDDITEADIELLRKAMVDMEEVEATDNLATETRNPSFVGIETQDVVKEAEEKGVAEETTASTTTTTTTLRPTTPTDIAPDLPSSETSSSETSSNTATNSSRSDSFVSVNSIEHPGAPPAMVSKGSKNRFRRPSFHPVPSFRNTTLSKQPSALDIKNARQATGRPVQTGGLSPIRASGSSGLRRALEVMSDEEIRNVLIQLGEEDKSTHAFTRSDMINIVFDGSRTDANIATALGAVAQNRAKTTPPNIKPNKNTDSTETKNQNNNNQNTTMHQSRSSALNMSRHASFKTSTGAAKVGIVGEEVWSSEAKAAVDALSRVARNVFRNTPNFNTNVANQRSAMPELLRDKPNVRDLSTTTASVLYMEHTAKVRRSSMFAGPKKNGETKTKSKMNSGVEGTGPSKSFVLKVIFPPVGIAHRHSKSFNSDALANGLNELHGSKETKKETTTLHERVRTTTESQLLESKKIFKPLDKGGFLKKRGHTVHIMTSNFKNRWFELDASNLLLTYYEKEPPTSVMGDGEGEALAEEKKKELKKGAVDLSIVEEIRPSEHNKTRAFDLVTITRTWVIWPSSDEDEAGWLANLCKIVPSDGVHDSYKEYIQMDPNTPTKINHKKGAKNNTKRSTLQDSKTKTEIEAASLGAEIDSQKVRCDPATTTVGMVLSECFRLFRKRTHNQEMDIGGSAKCALKVTGLREFMYTQSNLIADYQFVHEALLAGERDGSSNHGPITVELQLVPSDVLSELQEETKNAMDPGTPKSQYDTTTETTIVETDEEEDDEEEDEEVGELLTYDTTRRASLIPEKEAADKRRNSVMTSKNGNWMKYLDPETSEPFWYNELDGISQWEEPIGWVEPISIRTSTSSSSSTSSSNGRNSTLMNEKAVTNQGESYFDSIFNECNHEDTTTTATKEMNGTDMMSSIQLEEHLCNFDGGHAVGQKFLHTSRMSSASPSGISTMTVRDTDTSSGNISSSTPSSTESPSYSLFGGVPKAFSKRNARWPLRIHIESLHGIASSCSENRYVSKEIVTFPIQIVKVCVRMRVMVGGQPILGGTMETTPVPYERGMRFVHGFTSNDRNGNEWLSTKLNIASLPSSSRLFIEILGEKQGKDYEGLCDVVLASVCVQLCDHTGRMIHGRRALKLWPEVDVPAREIGHVCPTPWSQTVDLDDEDEEDEDKDGVSKKNGSSSKSLPSSSSASSNSSLSKSKNTSRNSGLQAIDEDALRKKMAAMMSGTLPTTSARPRPTIHLSFDRFVAPIVWGSTKRLNGGNKTTVNTGTPRGKGGLSNNVNNSTKSFVHQGSMFDFDEGDSNGGVEDLDLSMSGMLEIEKKTRFGAKKWKSYWVVLEENTGTLSWFKSKRMSDKCLGSIELASVDVEECPMKKRIYKKGKGTTLKDAETCCFKVNIESEPRNMIKGKYGAAILYFAHVSRREVRAWMDAIAKVGLTQSEHLEQQADEEDDDMQFGGRNKSNTTGSPDRSMVSRRGTVSGGRSRGGTASSTDSGNLQARKSRRGTGLNSRNGGNRLSSLSGMNANGGGSDLRGTGFDLEGNYTMGTIRSEWFDELEDVTTKAGHLRPQRIVQRGNQKGMSGSSSSISLRSTSSGVNPGEGLSRSVSAISSASCSMNNNAWLDLPIDLALLDPILAIQFGRTLNENEQGLLLIYIIVRLVKERKKNRIGYSSARSHLTRFEPLSSQTSEGNKSSPAPLSRKGSMSKRKKAPPPPPPDAVYIQDDVHSLLKEALKSQDLSDSKPLIQAYDISQKLLNEKWFAFVPSLAAKLQLNDNESDQDWFYWSRTRYFIWWYSVSNDDPNKTVDLLHIARRLRDMSNGASLKDKYTLSETTEYVAATVFESQMNSTAAVDFLHYHRHEAPDTKNTSIENNIDTLPSGKIFDVNMKLNQITTVCTPSLIQDGANAEQDRVLAMLGPLWFEALKEKDGIVHNSLWNQLLDSVFEDGESKEGEVVPECPSTSGGGPPGMSSPDSKNASALSSSSLSESEDTLSEMKSDTNNGKSRSPTSTSVGSTSSTSEESDSSTSNPSHTSHASHASNGSSSGLSNTTSVGGSSFTSPGPNSATASTSDAKRFRRRRGSTRDPLVFVEENDKIEKVIRSDPLHELSANEKALLWRHRKRLPERFKFAALPKLLRAVNWFNHAEKKSMLELLVTWPKPEPHEMLRILELLDEAFHEPDVRQYATNCLDDLTDKALAACLPQLVQALKYEPYHTSDLARFLLKRALLSPLLIGLPFFWCCKVELRGPHARERYSILIHCYLKHCGPVQRALVDQQAHLWSEEGAFAGVAAAVYACKGQGKKKYIR